MTVQLVPHSLGSLQGKAWPQLLHGQLWEMARQGPACTLQIKAPALPLLSLQLLLVCHFGWHFPKFKWPGWGKRVQQAQGTSTGVLHRQLTAGDDKEGKPGARSRKSSVRASRGLATSHWINSTLSIPEFLYTCLYLTYHNWPKLSVFFLMTVKSHQPSNCHGWGITMK